MLGNEDDTTHIIPQRHIPARFVTLIPREFPAAQVLKKSKRRSSANSTSSLSHAHPVLPTVNNRLNNTSQSILPTSLSSATNRSRQGNSNVKTMNNSSSLGSNNVNSDRNVTSQQLKQHNKSVSPPPSGNFGATEGELNDMINDLAYGGGNGDDLADFDTFMDFDFAGDELGKELAAAAGVSEIAPAPKSKTITHSKRRTAKSASTFADVLAAQQKQSASSNKTKKDKNSLAKKHGNESDNFSPNTSTPYANLSKSGTSKSKRKKKASAGVVDGAADEWSKSTKKKRKSASGEAGQQSKKKSKK